jgi:hypothetical protein
MDGVGGTVHEDGVVLMLMIAGAHEQPEDRSMFTTSMQARCLALVCAPVHRPLCVVRAVRALQGARARAIRGVPRG